MGGQSMTDGMGKTRTILLTGATGYVGSRLLTALLARGESVRCLVRRPDALPPQARDSAVQGDIQDEARVREALRGTDTAYYLVHAMAERGFSEVDRRCARVFAAAAREAGLRRIVYLGGLGHGDSLSEHLASRREVGDLLRSSDVPVIEFRASIIIGAGSLSFELFRTLVDKLPVMITPRWVQTRAQPLAVDDVIAYLVEALHVDLPQGGVFEIGGAEPVSYGAIMTEYARQRGLHRRMVPVPVLTPRVSSLWLSLVAPRYARIGRHLIEGVKNDTTVSDDAARRTFPVQPVGIQEAVRRAIRDLPSPSFALQGRAAGWALAACLGASFGAGGLGSLLSFEGISDWYPTLSKPWWTPPNAVFAPVWSVLFLLMGVAAWRVWRREGFREARLPLLAYAVQLVFNTAWSWIFFGLRSPAPALGEVVLLWLLILVTTVLFSARDRLASVLMLPYLAWVAFAAALNAAIVWLNP